MKKLLLLFMAAIVTVALGSCEDAMTYKNKKDGSMEEMDKTGRSSRKCQGSQCPMKIKEKNGRYDSKMPQKERMERRW
jgi:hypothetical protein